MTARLHQLNAPRERRATEKLRRDWSSLIREDAVPCISGFEIGPETSEWRKRFLLKEDSEPPRSVFIFCGKDAKSEFHASPLARSMVDVAPPHLRERLCRHCDEVARRLKTASHEGSFWHDGQEVFYRYILLPVSAGSHDLGYIIGAFSSSRQLQAA